MQHTKRPLTWVEYLAKIIIISTIAFSVIGIVGYSYDLYRHGGQRHYIGWFSSAGFVLLTVPISVRLIVLHLINWNAPHIQKYVVRIIWMIPIYAVESWLALRFKSFAIYIESIRESYEAYVIFSFLYFLIALLGEEQQLIQKLKQKPSEYGIHSWPINLFISPWIMGTEMLQKCKFGVFQYVIIKNVFAILVCIFAYKDWYQEGHFRIDGFYLYQCLICNMSQLWALYCLVIFYFATKEELYPWRPVGKFLSVKTVVFFTWWQSIFINIITNPINETIQSEDQWTNREISKGIQDYVICIEMFIASIVFTYTFTHKDYQSFNKDDDESEDSKPFLSAFLQSSVPDDILADLRRIVYSNGIIRKVMGDNHSSESIDKSESDIEINEKIEENEDEEENEIIIKTNSKDTMEVEMNIINVNNIDINSN